MPSVPLPFVVALLLLLLVAALLRDGDEHRRRPAFLVLIAACAFQSLLLGLRWGYGVDAAGFVLPIGAAAIPPLVYLSFAGLAGAGGGSRWRQALPHLLPALAVLALVMLWPAAIDAALVAISMGYALILARLWRLGPDALADARFGRAASARQAIAWAAAALASSAVVDGIVAFDIARLGGRHAGDIIAIANLCYFLVLGLAARTGSMAEPEETGETSPVETPAAEVRHHGDVGRDGRLGNEQREEQAILQAIDALMHERRAYRDPDLNLSRLARKIGRPSREVSQAVNRATGQNVSQYVNGFRIAEGCRRLAESEGSVTEIMLEVGFLTKSNFNREFQRVTGTSPSAWRKKPGALHETEAPRPTASHSSRDGAANVG